MLEFIKWYILEIHFAEKISEPIKPTANCFRYCSTCSASGEVLRFAHTELLFPSLKKELPPIFAKVLQDLVEFIDPSNNGE